MARAALIETPARGRLLFLNLFSGCSCSRVRSEVGEPKRPRTALEHAVSHSKCPHRALLIAFLNHVRKFDPCRGHWDVVADGTSFAWGVHSPREPRGTRRPRPGRTATTRRSLSAPSGATVRLRRGERRRVVPSGPDDSTGQFSKPPGSLDRGVVGRARPAAARSGARGQATHGARLERDGPALLTS